jgi:hypothetical protein
MIAPRQDLLTSNFKPYHLASTHLVIPGLFRDPASDFAVALILLYQTQEKAIHHRGLGER